jgi:hypothetical protein
MKKRTIAALLCGASVIGLSAGPAFAGEVNGRGKGTPILSHDEDPANQVGNVTVLPSACSYSGLEDGGDYEGQPAGPGVVQSFGVYGPASLDGATVSATAKLGIIDEIGPGTECRGSWGGAVRP